VLTLVDSSISVVEELTLKLGHAELEKVLGKMSQNINFMRSLID
jgi:hypothetical protein